MPRDYYIFALLNRPYDFREAVFCFCDADVHDSIIAIINGYFQGATSEGPTPGPRIVLSFNIASIQNYSTRI